MTEDDDWFERALREDDESEGGESEGGDRADDGEKQEPGADSGGPDSAEAELEHAEDDPGGFGDAPDFGAEGNADDAEQIDADSIDADPTDAAVGDDGPGEGGEFGMGGEFDADDTGPAGFGASDDAPDAESDDGGFGASDGDSTGNAGDAGGAGGGFADADPYDGDDEEDELFEDDFASAFENAPGGGMDAGGMGGGASDDASGGFGGAGGAGGGAGGFGMDADEGFGGGFGGGDGPFEDESFDDEEFESSIPRIDLGIEGLDDMIQGGVPERSLITTVGSAGTGKTTFGLQFLHEALQQGESAVFITLEESHDRIVNTATEKGWDFDEYEKNGQLAVIDLDPIEMANSLTSIRNDLPRLVEQFGASRLVLDSVSLLEMMYDNQATRRNEVYDFTKSLKEAGVTTMLTSEASEDNAYASRHGIIEYLVDAVFILRYIRSGDDFRETRLAVEIQKIRDANHSREIKPYSITNEGISVYRQANIF